MSDEYIFKWAERLEGLKTVGFSFSEIEEKLRKKIKRHLKEACENIKIEVAKEYEKMGRLQHFSSLLIATELKC